MPKDKVISVRVDSDVKEKLSEAAAKLGQTESALARSIIAEYLGESDPTSIDSMLGRLDDLERKCNRLAKIALN